MPRLPNPFFPPQLHQDFEHALAETKLPERPDYEVANHFLVKARRLAADGCCKENSSGRKS